MKQIHATLAFSLTALCFPALGKCAPTPPGCTLPQRNISISGNNLTKNGSTWLPRGLQIRGFLSSYQTASDNNSVQPAPGSPGYDGSWQATMNAQNTYENDGPAELGAATSWGADELRFQVSQPGLDPAAGDGASTSTWTAPVDLIGVPLYKADYLTRLVKAINVARCAGFVVILSMQDEPRTGDQWPNTPTHTAACLCRAWRPSVHGSLSSRNLAPRETCCSKFITNPDSRYQVPTGVIGLIVMTRFLLRPVKPESLGWGR